jgi:DNA mismatch endonuclease (patch repair protein)
LYYPCDCAGRIPGLDILSRAKNIQLTDIVDKETRSRMMSGIGGKNTKPELVVRRELHCRGFRFKLHDKRLPGKPDLVLPKYRAVIFVNGCFWHGHECSLFKWPKSRPNFWREKICSNRSRDRENIDQCLALGWRVLTIFECSIKGRKQQGVDQTIEQTVKWLLGATEYQSIGESGDK